MRSPPVGNAQVRNVSDLGVCLGVQRRPYPNFHRKNNSVGPP